MKYFYTSGKLGQDFLIFYEEALGINIKNLYDSTVDDERGYEAWFEENFENRSGQ